MKIQKWIVLKGTDLSVPKWVVGNETGLASEGWFSNAAETFPQRLKPIDFKDSLWHG
jgi:hypothetical protein